MLKYEVQYEYEYEKDSELECARKKYRIDRESAYQCSTMKSYVASPLLFEIII